MCAPIIPAPPPAVATPAPTPPPTVPPAPAPPAPGNPPGPPPPSVALDLHNSVVWCVVGPIPFDAIIANRGGYPILSSGATVDVVVQNPGDAPATVEISAWSDYSQPQFAPLPMPQTVVIPAHNYGTLRMGFGFTSGDAFGFNMHVSVGGVEIILPLPVL